MWEDPDAANGRHRHARVGAGQETEKILAAPDIRQKLAKVGVIVATLPPGQFGAFFKSEIVRWTADAKAAGIEPQ